MLLARKIIIFALIVLVAFPFCATISKSAEFMPPVLYIAPREIDFGTIIPGEASSGLFSLKNMGSGSLEWLTKGPEGWRITDGAEIITFMRKKIDYLRIEIRSLPDDEQLIKGSAAGTAYNSVEIKFETEAQTFTCSKELSEGVHKEAIRIISTGGDRTIFVTFSIASTQKNALII